MSEDVVDVDSFNLTDEFEEFDLHETFVYYNNLCFDGFLDRVTVSWSKRLTLSAGVCVYKSEGYCEIKISESILKYRTTRECKETLLHEMIHAYLFLNSLSFNRGHGKEFTWHMNRINQITGLNVTVFHEFHDEVDYLRKHIWRCNGPCRLRPPYFGYIKRSRNLAPGPRDFWWERHRSSCDGEFIKISGNSNINTKSRVNKNKKIHNNTIEKYLMSTSTTHRDGAKKPSDDSDGSSVKPIVIKDKE
ncbi:hypothetical protein MACK_002831 [Theileria orientalis]|uniref:SprT-like domain-containing protein n=1 Tax=Theileria orientalis TaxID=68886 RepID=A0A976MDN2_THEOR|nr:hypothetical protein MACK_002831 [Theileria orientalis]